MSTKKSIEADDKQSRIVWRPDEWLNFAVTYLHIFPARSPLEANFKIRKEEFLEVQKSAISFDRQRPVHNDVLIKAGLRLTKIAEERGIPSLMSMKPFSAWTQDDYVAVANQLHVLRFDLNLLSSTVPSGFTAQDLMDAQSALHPDKRVEIKEVSAYVAPLKGAYERIRQGGEGTTVTVTGRNHEHLVIKSADMAAMGDATLIRWKDSEIYLLAKEIHRRAPHKNYPYASSLKPINTEVIICAQREALSKDRRRNKDSIAQSMGKIRERLAVAFQSLRGEIERGEDKPEPVTQVSTSFVDASKATVFTPGNKPTRTPEEIRVLAENLKSQDLPEAPIAASLPTPGSNAAAVEAIIAAARPLISVMLDQALQALAVNLAPHVAQHLAPYVSEMIAKGSVAGAIASGAAPSGQVEKAHAPSSSVAPASPARFAEPAQAETVRESAYAEHASDDVNGNVAAEVSHHEEDDQNDVNGNVAFPSHAASHSLAAEENDFSHIDDIVLKTPNAHESRLLETKVLGTMIDRSGKPHLGIVGVKGKHVEELKDMYPDVHFFCVERTSPEIMAELSKCDRVIGVEGYVNPIADQFLKKMIKDRYKTYSGGLAAVKAEIANWLRVWGTPSLRAA